ncbi:MAG: hypothetical protein II520_01335, partial [Bacilli bacterium]|nr:hypothetical protein [Bacilli bacterium]
GVVGSYLLGQNDAETTHFKLDGLLMRYKDGNDENMFNVLASHDIQRFLNLCQGDKDLALLGYAIMMFYIGIPMIYYGEEILMEGGGDPDCRRGMDWGKANHPDEYAAFFAELMRLRADSLFKEGALSISAENGLLKMRRGEGKNALTLLLNAGKDAVSFSKAGKGILCRNIDGDTLLPKGILIYRG